MSVCLTDGRTLVTPIREDRMSARKNAVQTYIEGLRRNDHAMVLGCLADDPRGAVSDEQARAALNKRSAQDVYSSCQFHHSYGGVWG